MFLFDNIAEQKASRLDVWLAEQLPEFSRSRWQMLIKEGRVTVNGAPCETNQTVHEGDRIQGSVPPPADPVPKPEAIPLSVLYEDSDLIVINKPPGLVVHPAAGNETGTLVNALLHHCADLAGIGGEKRPGIVHRLDKDTSGVLAAVKNESAMREIARQFKQRETEKEYTALVCGVPVPPSGTVETPVGRHPVHRKKMAVNVRTGRPARSGYQVEESFGDAAKVRVRIETGRTHQIRVHMAHIRHPVLGDTVYGRPFRIHPPRQMLHASVLRLTHPVSGKRLSFEAPLPPDMESVLQQLRNK